MASSCISRRATTSAASRCWRAGPRRRAIARRTPRPRVPAANAGQTVIANNVIRDSNLEGIIVLTDTGVAAGYTITDTVVRDLSQNLPRPESFTPQVDIVRSRAFTLIALNGSRVDPRHRPVSRRERGAGRATMRPTAPSSSPAATRLS